jgi:hypothetical protein
MEKRLDFAPSQRASPQRLAVKQFLANHNISVPKYPPYSPYLSPCDFYMFPKIKSVLKETHFSQIEVKAKTEILNSLSESDLRNCIVCVNSKGNYFEDPT